MDYNKLNIFIMNRNDCKNFKNLQFSFIKNTLNEKKYVIQRHTYNIANNANMELLKYHS
jgi:hypothetical protein